MHRSILDQFGTKQDKKQPQVIENYGGASRARTDDLIVANDALCRNDLTDSIRLCSVFSTETPRLLEQ
jgi:hypothetical protein